MYRKLPIFSMFMIFSLAVKTLPAQSLRGITGKPDTSYTTYSAYLNSVKTNPGITIVQSFQIPSIIEKGDITYCKIGKRSLKLDAFYPKTKAAKPGTAILIIHGGGWRSGNRYQHQPLAQKLAELGYTCFTPEYRLSTEALFPAAIFDIKAAIRWIRENAEKYNVDTSKIVALGFSAGGEMAAFLGTTGNMPLFEGTNCNTHQSSGVNAVVDIDGTLSFVHPESGEGDDSKKTSAGTYWFGYAKKENPEIWKAASPLSYVSGKTPPTLFINSSVERMHAGRDDFIKVLNENNIYSEVQNFPDAPHSFCLFEPWFQPTVNYIDSFLKKIFHQ
ncbi:alpha/beta hydrolase [Ferruginibacter sp. HRS2-29]|uniref:alpha/beta hydrolase n=1 Tax=Ferruginibacter sp. HRS2-29 TaxID=2487334 RepID=UPI0020CD6453|nr:alpha/beta hydrolase [Ferruginibacter sp. HRS2-29]MCP9752004.1 alpha/beta hydrolase [Ferruginibacter sp. HRS2-29]